MKAVQKGFTLVEIAIVLVIIGLLLGGILKGQEMITQAKIKNVVADFSGISAAYYGYQDRYRAIPGDDPNAGTRWASAPAATSGNGDGVVGGTYNMSLPVHVCWRDRPGQQRHACGGTTCAARASLPATAPKQPFNAVTGLLGVQTGDGAGGVALGGFGGLIVCSANLPDKIATAVDTQMDDGVTGQRHGTRDREHGRTQPHCRTG